MTARGREQTERETLHYTFDKAAGERWRFNDVADAGVTPHCSDLSGSLAFAAAVVSGLRLDGVMVERKRGEREEEEIGKRMFVQGRRKEKRGSELKLQHKGRTMT